MADDSYSLVIDVPQPGLVRLELFDSLGGVVSVSDVPQTSPVDNFLLTSVDDLLKRSSIDKSALATVSVGPGVDKNSSLYRMVNSIGSAVSVSRVLPGTGRKRRK